MYVWSSYAMMASQIFVSRSKNKLKWKERAHRQESSSSSSSSLNYRVGTLYVHMYPTDTVFKICAVSTRGNIWLHIQHNVPTTTLWCTWFLPILFSRSISHSHLLSRVIQAAFHPTNFLWCACMEPSCIMTVATTRSLIRSLTRLFIRLFVLNNDGTENVNRIESNANKVHSTGIRHTMRTHTS